MKRGVEGQIDRVRKVLQAAALLALAAAIHWGLG
jgi:hypothetical protein